MALGHRREGRQVEAWSGVAARGCRGSRRCQREVLIARVDHQHAALAHVVVQLGDGAAEGVPARSRSPSRETGRPRARPAPDRPRRAGRFDRGALGQRHHEAEQARLRDLGRSSCRRSRVYRTRRRARSAGPCSPVLRRRRRRPVRRSAHAATAPRSLPASASAAMASSSSRISAAARKQGFNSVSVRAPSVSTHCTRRKGGQGGQGGVGGQRVMGASRSGLGAANRLVEAWRRIRWWRSGRRPRPR